eukprot:3791608-Pyramimonas_sp.AAC.1
MGYRDEAAAILFMKTVAHQYITGQIDKPELESKKRAWLAENGQTVRKRPAMQDATSICKKPSAKTVDDGDIADEGES